MFPRMMTYILNLQLHSDYKLLFFSFCAFENQLFVIFTAIAFLIAKYHAKASLLHLCCLFSSSELYLQQI